MLAFGNKWALECLRDGQRKYCLGGVSWRVLRCGIADDLLVRRQQRTTRLDPAARLAILRYQANPLAEHVGGRAAPS